MPALIALNGEFKGQQVLLEPGLHVTVGRSNKNMLILPNDHLISGAHCAFKEGPNGWLVEDLGSTNGTMLNGELFSGKQDLEDQNVVTIGSTQFRFVRNTGQTKSIAKRPPPKSAASKSQTALIDGYDEILESLPSAGTQGATDTYDEMLQALPGTATSPGLKMPVESDSYYDEVLAGKSEDTVAQPDLSLDDWLKSPSKTNLIWAMSSIFLLFIVMMLFFTRVV